MFVFYEYTAPTGTFQDTMVREWGGSGLTQRAQDDCRTQYTGTIDVPGVGATPVVVDVYRHSPFMAVTAAAGGGGQWQRQHRLHHPAVPGRRPRQPVRGG